MFSVTVISQCSGLALLTMLLPFVHAHVAMSDLVWGACAGICGGLGIALLYHALSIGRMGIVSPLTAVLSAAFPVVFGVFRGEALGGLQIAGILIALVAIVLISTSSEPDGQREFRLAGVREAVASGMLLGGFYIFIGFTHPDAGFSQLFAARVASIALLCILAFVVRKSLVPARGSLKTIVFAGLVDMSANAVFVLAAHAGLLSIAAVLTSLYPAATVFWAWVILKERLTPVQWTGAVAAIAGVVLIGL